MPLISSLLPRLIALAERWPGLMAIFGFASGAASYLLVERSQGLAQVITLLMLVTWLWLVLENGLRDGLLNRFGVKVPPVVGQYLTQMVHQESLFFALPFFLAVTRWDHGQALFTGLLILSALVSVIDPLYYRRIAARRSLFVIFHALAQFALLLVVLPLILHLTTAQSLALALSMALLFSLPSLITLTRNTRWWRLPLLALLLVMLGGGIWQARAWVPPAALRLADITLSQQLDPARRTPGKGLTTLDAASLKGGGLYAWTAVSAPRGLRERIHHVWLQNGREVDRITLDIEGGRKEGYRAWTVKQKFPADPVGRWQVRVVTDSGQLIGLTRFTVHPSPSPPAREQTTAGTLSGPHTQAPGEPPLSQTPPRARAEDEPPNQAGLGDPEPSAPASDASSAPIPTPP